jgi:hypothetical protein
MRALLVLACLTATLAGCRYDPQFAPGVTRCADRTGACPARLICDTDSGVCVSGDGPADSVPAAGDATRAVAAVPDRQVDGG